MPINSRRKGAKGELELAKYLKDRGFPCRRGQQFKGGADSPDVLSECEGLKDIHIECKRVEAGNPYDWLAQAKRDAGGRKTPVVMHRKSYQDWIVVLTLDDFLNYALTRSI